MGRKTRTTQESRMILEDINTLENSLLDELLPCTGGHTHCGQEAEHLIIWCGNPIPVCNNYVVIHMPYARLPGRTCARCGQKITSCWRTVPI